MITQAVFCFLMIATVRGGDNKPSGISQFWTDDYKVFDQIYGKTSDKDLYGATLPPAISFDVQKSPIKVEASERKERYNTKNILDEDFGNNFNDRYAKLFSKSLYPEKEKSGLQFIRLSNTKPISASNDPETYNYLKKLEKKTKDKEDLLKRPYIGFDSESDEAYKSVQDILDAHEANKGDSEEFRTDLGTKNPKIIDERPRNRIRNKVRFINNNSIKSRCVSGRCRKPIRTPRPYLKIKRYRYSK